MNSQTSPRNSASIRVGSGWSIKKGQSGRVQSKNLGGGQAKETAKTVNLYHYQPHSEGSKRVGGALEVRWRGHNTL